MNLQDILNQYDDVNRKKFYDHELRGSLSQIPLEEQQTDAYRYEMLAFSLVGNGNENDWGTYYGPMFTGRKEDGTPAYVPPFESITNEAVLYWESRIPKTNNPLLKMQYSGLVWDFKRKVCSDRYPSSLYTDYVTAMIDVINGDYEPHDVITVNVIERLSSFIKRDEQFKTQIKGALLRFDNERTSEDASARLWGAYIRFITEHKTWFTPEEEAACITNHESRISRLISPTNNNPWAVSEQAKALADYYKSRGKSEDLKRVLLVMEQSFRAAKNTMEPMQWMGNLEQIARTFTFYGLNDERARLLKEIEQAGCEAAKTLQPTGVSVDIPQEAFDQIKVFLTKGTLKEQYERFCIKYIPSIQQESIQLKQLANQYPLVYMMPTHLMDKQGRPASIIGGIDNDFDGQLVLHVCKELQISSVFMRYGIQQLRETKALTTDVIMARLKESPIIDINRHEIIRQALLAYDSENYITMCHLIVPQIEDAFRTLIDKSGKAVIRPQKDKNNPGFTQRILDDILKDKVIIETFGEDFSFYARILLTDQRGLNIRNNLCHGLVEPAFFNYVIADRLLHLFCVLTLVRYNS